MRHEGFSGLGELVTDEAQSKHPAAEGVGFVFGLLGLGACVGDLLGKLAHGEAKVDVCPHLSGIDAALASIVGVSELEQSELYRLSERSGKRSYPNKFFIRRLPENSSPNHSLSLQMFG